MILAVIGAGVAIALIGLTTNLHRAAHEIGTEVESLRIGEELEFGLVSLREASELVARTASADLVRDQLAEAEDYAGSREEQQILANLGRQIDQYIAAIDRAAAGGASTERVQEETRAAFESAFASARKWARLNVEQSRAAGSSAARWDEIATLVGVAAILLLVVGLGSLAWWLQRGTFRPALKLVGAIERYARGERSARASEQGAEEFRTIARCFNDMAENLERQRADQLAFLAGVAHDIRNPLGALKMATEMFRPDEPLPPEPRVRQLVARVDRQIDRLERMVYDFLDASRIESGNLELQIEDCDMRDLVRDTLDLFEPSARTHPLVVSAPDEPVRLRCDPMRMEQVLGNLVSNAIKYSPGGSPVRVTIARRPEAVLVSVADQGIGMSPDDVAQVFEPFHRAGASKQAIPGVGLGLFVARRIVEAHGGEIAVESTQGAGSTFTVHLPVGASPHGQVADQNSARRA
ncbi:MAG TPA: HAMP domain-containing sensor histidine kinase [Kofleriaceae bacterium]